MTYKAVMGLRSATQEQINTLKLKYPSGAHVTHKLNGDKLPHNGIFTTYISPTLSKWAKL